VKRDDEATAADATHAETPSAATSERRRNLSVLVPELIAATVRSACEVPRWTDLSDSWVAAAERLDEVNGQEGGDHGCDRGKATITLCSTCPPPSAGEVLDPYCSVWPSP
jgi:hypothetical protein